METNVPHPGRDDARDALEVVGRSEAVARRPRLPGWYFPVMAVVVGVVMAVQPLPSTQRITLLGAAVVLILMVNRHVQTSTGIAWDATRLRGQAPFLAVMLVVVIATAITAAMTEAGWVWAVGAGVAAVVVLGAGVLYQRQSLADG